IRGTTGKRSAQPWQSNTTSGASRTAPRAIAEQEIALRSNDAQGRWLETLGEIGERASWRALAPLFDSPEHQALVMGEPPRGVDERAGVSRRALLKLLGASMALAGIAGCTQRAPGKILPYTDDPRGIVPTLPQYFATSMVLDGYAIGLLAESYAGRPIKIEG